MHVEKALKSAQNFDELYKYAKDANPNLSFWGTKTITIKGYEGVLPIDALTKKALELVLQSPGYPIDHNNHCFIRGYFSHEIDRTYDKSDEQVRTANCFTWLLAIIRSYRFLSPNFTPLRWIWREIESRDRNTLSLRNAIEMHHLVNIGELKLYLDYNPDYSFWRQLKEDFYWKIVVLVL